MAGLKRGDSTYRKATLAMLAVGLATFNGMYCTQALLPTLSHAFNIPPTTAALTISATTGILALCVVPASILSERWGRGPVLTRSLLFASLLGLLIPFVSSPFILIGIRAVQGLFFAGTPAVAMTWLSEEIDAQDLAHAMGLYIAGNSVGGLIGRLIPSGVVEFADWRWAMGINACFALTMAILVLVLLPQQRNFRPKELHLRTELQAMAGHWRNPRLATLFVIPFLAMGVFVSIYNYLGFRLISVFGLSEGLVGLLFIMYLSGTWSSARAGKMINRFGRGPVLTFSALLMLLPLPLLGLRSLYLVLIALLVFTAGFFALHSTASSWVGLLAKTHRAEASSTYILNYYTGSSIVGWLSGYLMHYGWWYFIGWLAALSLVIVGLGALLQHRSD